MAEDLTEQIFKDAMIKLTRREKLALRKKGDPLRHLPESERDEFRKKIVLARGETTDDGEKLFEIKFSCENRTEEDFERNWKIMEKNLLEQITELEKQGWKLKNILGAEFSVEKLED